MESILVHPKNTKESKMIKAILKALNVKFEIQPETLPPHVLEGIERGLEQIKNGQTISLGEFKRKHLQKR